jgi:hypothetical protein
MHSAESDLMLGAPAPQPSKESHELLGPRDEMILAYGIHAELGKEVDCHVANVLLWMEEPET